MEVEEALRTKTKNADGGSWRTSDLRGKGWRKRIKERGGGRKRREGKEPEGRDKLSVISGLDNPKPEAKGKGERVREAEWEKARKKWG